MVASTIETRIADLSNNVFSIIDKYTIDEIVVSFPTLKTELAELYYLRDLNLNLDAKQQIMWALNKLRLSNNFQDLLPNLSIFENNTDISAFYKCCSLDALLYLGY